jgi:hypothetical protein
VPKLVSAGEGRQDPHNQGPSDLTGRKGTLGVSGRARAAGPTSWQTRLTRVTHGAPKAAAAACAVAAMASYAVEGCPARELISVALTELEQALGEHPAAAVWLQAARAAADGSWRPGPAGVRLARRHRT